VNTAESIKNTIAGYVQANTFHDGKEIKNQTLLFKEGIFDSMAFVLLIDFIEEKFGIKPGDEDLIEENFESINAISTFIERKQGLIKQ